ncbi:MAG: divergent polysaccharide deacetylase family protein [Alphaproteobacteria bacterium]|nr:divergent polysaccharide deacetylase family protein [Alphaproteobacteria bacterium]
MIALSATMILGMFAAMSSEPPRRDRLTFIVIGIVFLIFLDRVVMQGDRPYFHPEQLYGPKEAAETSPPLALPVEPAPKSVGPETLPDPMTPHQFHEEFPELVPDPVPEETLPVDPGDPTGPDVQEIGFTEVDDLRMSIRMIDIAHPPVDSGVRIQILPEAPESGAAAWQRNAVKADIPKGMPRIAIILDDVGVNRSMSEAALGLPGPLTLAFLPYAEGVGAMAREARGRGHELMVHMPMEPLNGHLDPGPGVLLAGAGRDSFMATLEKNLGAIEGYVGINNHMGSKLTQDRTAMANVMGELRRRGLLFVDSKTIHSSLAGQTAADFEVPYGVRDVFLDHYPDFPSVMESLAKLEDIALEHGSAIGIGHPKADTIRALYEWLPSLEAKGIALAPVSAVVKAPSRPVVAAKVQELPLPPE